MNYSFIFGLISIVAGLTPEMLKKLSEWSKVPSKANQSKHHAVFNMMKRGGFFDPRNMIRLIAGLNGRISSILSSVEP